MKKRVITGLISIFVVVVVGGGLVSHVMEQLYSINNARTHIDQVSRTINKLDIMVLNTVSGIEYVQHGDEEVRKLIDEVDEIQRTMSELEGQIMSRTFAVQSCGVCHQRPERLVRNLNMITQGMEETFGDLIMLTSILVTGGVENALGRVLSEMGSTLESYHSHVKNLDNILTPMTEHINAEVSSNIVRIKRTHDATIIVTTLFVLLGIILLASAMTRPIAKLSKGTENKWKQKLGYNV